MILIISDEFGESLYFIYTEPPLVSGCQLPSYNLYATEDGSVFYNHIYMHFILLLLNIISYL